MKDMRGDKGKTKERATSRAMRPLWIAVMWIAVLLFALSVCSVSNAAPKNLLDETQPDETIQTADGDEFFFTDKGAEETIGESSTYSVDLPSITLSNCINRALCDSYRLKMARQAVDMARAGGRSALAVFLPDLNFTYAYTRLADVNVIEVPGGGEFTLGSINTFFLGLSFRYPIYSGGQDQATERASEAESMASELRVEQAETLIISGVVSAYSFVLEAKQGLEVSLASRRHLDEVLRSTQASYDQGLIPLNDLLSVEVAQASAEQAVLQAERNLEIAQSGLATLIGADIGDRWTLEPIDYPINEVPFSVETLWEWALVQRPELREFCYQREALEAQMDAVRSGRKPRVNFQADVSRTGDKPDGSSGDGGGFGAGTNIQGVISIYWDLYDFGRVDELLAPLEEQLAMLDIQEADIRAQVKQEVESTLLNVLNQFENTRITSAALVQAEEAYRVAQRRQEEGLGLTLQVLDAEATLMSTNAGNVHTRYEYYRGLASLAASIGASIDDLVVLMVAAREESE